MLDIRIARSHRELAPADFGARFGPDVAKLEVSETIDALMLILDTLDGDPDFEPEFDLCAANDDGCGPIDINGVRHWGSEHEQGYCPILPIYGEDQSKGPHNVARAAAEWARMQRGE